jgi:hypothetical protein
MNPARTLLLAAFSMAALACAAPAAAQWAWRDAAGHMVYSDLPPPSSVPARNIVRQPSAKPALRADAMPEAPNEAPAEAKAQPEPPRAAAPPRAPTYVEREIESRQRQQQLAAAEKKAADEDARKAQMAENCARLRAYQRALEGGFRVARLNAAGQRPAGLAPPPHRNPHPACLLGVDRQRPVNLDPVAVVQRIGRLAKLAEHADFEFAVRQLGHGVANPAGLDRRADGGARRQPQRLLEHPSRPQVDHADTQPGIVLSGPHKVPPRGA